MNIQAAIFDLDGTITEPWFDFDAIREQMGLASDSGPVWEAMMQMPPARKQDAMRILDSHEQRAVKESTLNPGAKQLMSELRGLGIKIGVITRNTRANTIAVAAKHGLSFDEVYGRDQGPVKPDPFGVLELCRRFMVSPNQVVVVGDYLFDLLCARSAGAVSVWLRNHDHDRDLSGHADFTIDNLGQLVGLIRN